jgi:putative glutamine amidotransferase
VEKYCFLRQAYIHSVVAAGGLPILLPVGVDLAMLEDYLDGVEGLILSGGGDIDSAYFGELPHPGLGEISPERDEFEIELVRLALKREIPLVGICRGVQVLNVAAGGDIYQDLLDQKPGGIMHQQNAPRDYPIHPVAVASGSRLAQVLTLESKWDSGLKYDLDLDSSGITMRVNSLHHQAIRKVAPNFRVSAWAPDGVIEAVEIITDTLVIGVQWHPEYLWEKDPRFLGLFRSLVEAAVVRKG